MHSATQAFLDTLDTLDVRRRQTAMVDLVRQTPGSGLTAVVRGLFGQPADPVRTILDDLMTGEPYHRCMGIFGHAVRGDVEPVLAALHDDSAQVRKLACRLAVLHGQDAPLAAAFLTASPDTRQRLVGQICRRRRTPLAEALVPDLLLRGHHSHARRLLPLCSTATVRAFLPQLGDAGLPWRRLALRHPELTLERMSQQLHAATPNSRTWIWYAVASALPPLVQHHPAALMRLVLAYAPEDTVPPSILDVLGRLARHAPHDVTELLVAYARRPWLLRAGIPKRLHKHLRALGRADLYRLARALSEQPTHLRVLLTCLPPSERDAVFLHAFAEKDISRVPWTADLLRALPHAARQREASRMLGLAAIVEDPRRHLLTLACLRLDAAQPKLEAACRASRAEDRQMGWIALLSCVRMNREGLTEVLGLMRRLKNEQDPVRMVAIQGLATTSASLFEPEHVSDLHAFVQATMEARDTSHATRRALQQLAHRLLCAYATDPRDPRFVFALDTLTALAGQAGMLDFPRLDQNLPRGVEDAMVAALLPWVRRASARALHHNAVRLATMLGKRAWHQSDLQDLLLDAVLSTSGPHHQAANLWLACPDTREERVRQLLDKDPSAIMLPRVFRVLHLSRQDWLDPYLHGRRLKGRWAHKAGYVPPVTDGFSRWVPRQQRALGTVLHRVISDKEQTVWTRASTVRTYAKLPVTQAADLLPLVASEEVPIAEAALGALVWLDRPAPALEILQDHLHGDRARVAMYALPRMLRMVAPTVASTTLRQLLGRAQQKVTVSKEVLRLIGKHRIEGADELLWDTWRTDLHRDVRVAMLHAAKARLPAAFAWDILSEASVHPEAALANSLLDTRPHDLHPDHRAGYLTRLLALETHPDLPVRRRLMQVLKVVGRRGSWLVIQPDAIAALGARTVLDLEAGSAWKDAVQLLVGASRQPQGLAHFRRTVGALQQRAVDGSVTPDLDQDLPHHQRLRALAQNVCSRPLAVRADYQPALKVLTELLSAHPDPTFAPERIEAWVLGLDLTKPEDVVGQLFTALEHASPSENRWIRTAVKGVCSDPAYAWNDSVVLALCDALSAGGVSARQLSLDLVQCGGTRTRWAQPWRDRLAARRQDPDLELAAAALRVTVGEG